MADDASASSKLRFTKRKERATAPSLYFDKKFLQLRRFVVSRKRYLRNRISIKWKNDYPERWITWLVDRWRTQLIARQLVNCRTHEHRHFERTLRSTEMSPGPRLAEGRSKNKTRLLVLYERINWAFAGARNRERLNHSFRFFFVPKRRFKWNNLFIFFLFLSSNFCFTKFKVSKALEKRKKRKVNIKGLRYRKLFEKIASASSVESRSLYSLQGRTDLYVRLQFFFYYRPPVTKIYVLILFSFLRLWIIERKKWRNILRVSLKKVKKKSYDKHSFDDLRAGEITRWI